MLKLTESKFDAKKYQQSEINNRRKEINFSESLKFNFVRKALVN